MTLSRRRLRERHEALVYAPLSRLSLTESPGKIASPCGARAIPLRTMPGVLRPTPWVRRPPISLPSKMIEPSCQPVRPTIVLSNVVLP